MIIHENLVKDDNGYYWVYGGGKIRGLGDDTEGGGYYCDSFRDGVELLHEYGYLEKLPDNLEEYE